MWDIVLPEVVAGVVVGLGFVGGFRADVFRGGSRRRYADVRRRRYADVLRGVSRRFYADLMHRFYTEGFTQISADLRRRCSPNGISQILNPKNGG